MTGPRTTGALRLLAATSGLIVWASAFISLYAGLSLGCEGGLHRVQVAGTNALTVLLAVLWVGHLAVHGWAQRYGIVQCRRAGGTEPDRFLANLTYSIGFVGLTATIFTGLPVLFLSPCV